jgi:hypothetical protein
VLFVLVKNEMQTQGEAIVTGVGPGSFNSSLHSFPPSSRIKSLLIYDLELTWVFSFLNSFLLDPGRHHLSLRGSLYSILFGKTRIKTRRSRRGETGGKANVTYFSSPAFNQLVKHANAIPRGGNGDSRGSNGDSRGGNGDSRGGNGDSRGSNGDSRGGNGARRYARDRFEYYTLGLPLEPGKSPSDLPD